MVYAVVNLASQSVNPVAKYATIASFVNLFSPILTVGGAMVFLGMTLSAAFLVITAAGSAEKIAKAQRTFMFAVIGLVIVISSFLLVKLIGVMFNIQEELRPFGF